MVKSFFCVYFWFGCFYFYDVLDQKLIPWLGSVVVLDVVKIWRFSDIFGFFVLIEIYFYFHVVYQFTRTLMLIYYIMFLHRLRLRCMHMHRQATVLF